MKITADIKLKSGDTVRGETVNISSFNKLKKIIISEKYCLGLFKENIIRKENFLECRSIALDFDKGYSLPEALRDFKKYKCIIATTRNHQKEKNGLKADRFRVILFLTEPIKNNDDFRATFKKLLEAFPKLDKSCSNSSRWFYPSKDIILTNKTGISIKPIKSEKGPIPDADIDSYLQTPGKGKLSKKTKNILKHGPKEGERNHSTFVIAKDMQENGYNEDDAVKYIIKAYNETDTLSFDFTEDEIAQTVNSAYNTPGTNAARKPFKLIHIFELYKHAKKMEWTVGDLLSKGGVSLLSAPPKAGKSTLARQLIKSILTGEDFLKRKTVKGEVLYFAIEEQPEAIVESFKRMGLPNDSPLYVHTGDIFSENILKDFYTILKDRKPKLAVLDTLFDFLDVESENNYKEVKIEFRKLREIARQTGTHILCIHHANKTFGGPTGSHRSVLGSQAIVGGVDAIILLEPFDTSRLVTTMGRMIKRWVTREMLWDESTETYTLGKKVEIDDEY